MISNEQLSSTVNKYKEIGGSRSTQTGGIEAAAFDFTSQLRGCWGLQALPTILLA